MTESNQSYQSYRSGRNYADQESDWSRVVLIKSLEKFAEQQYFFVDQNLPIFFFLIGNSSFSLMFRTDVRVRNGRVPKYPKVTERYPSNPKYTRFRARISNTLSLRWTFFGSIMTRLFIPRTSVFVRVFQTLFVVSVVTLFWQLFLFFLDRNLFFFIFFIFFFSLGLYLGFNVSRV